jgi:hypothetical protein
VHAAAATPFRPYEVIEAKKLAIVETQQAAAEVCVIFFLFADARANNRPKKKEDDAGIEPWPGAA